MLYKALINEAVPVSNSEMTLNAVMIEANTVKRRLACCLANRMP